MDRKQFVEVFDVDCETFSYCFACEIPDNITLNLASNCSSILKIDSYYYIDFDSLKRGNIEFIGYSGTSKIIQKQGGSLILVWQIQMSMNLKR
jgi:hypothetical protein